MTSTLRLLATLCIVALTAACAGGQDQASDAATSTASEAPAATAGQDDAAVSVVSIAFTPATLTVTPGTEVTWTSGDAGVRHTVTSGEPGQDAVPGVSEATPATTDGLFDGPLPDSGSTFAFVFAEAGTYPYFCQVHPSMTAEVVVG